MFLKIYKRDTVKQNSRTFSLRASRSTQQVRKKYTSRLHFAASKSDFFTILVSLRRKVLCLCFLYFLYLIIVQSLTNNIEQIREDLMVILNC